MDYDSWIKLPLEKQIIFLQNIIETLRIPFKIVNLHNFENICIGILEYDSCEFLFIPGCKNVTLGWQNTSTLNMMLMDDLYKIDNPLGLYKSLLNKEKNPDYINYYNSQIESIKNGTFELPDFIKQHYHNKEMIYNYISSHTSPMRFVDIPSLIVEKQPQKITSEKAEIMGYYDIATQKCSIPIAEDILNKLKSAAMLNATTINIPNKFYIYLSHDKKKYYLTPPKIEIHFDDILSRITKEGFSLMNEDQWEYVCGAGNSSIFRWGNFYPNDRDTRYNFWGIDMCQKNTDREIIYSTFFTKGGDGGRIQAELLEYELTFALHFPMSTSYREPYNLSDNLISKTQSSFFYRRAIIL